MQKLQNRLFLEASLEDLSMTAQHLEKITDHKCLILNSRAIVRLKSNKNDNQQNRSESVQTKNIRNFNDTAGTLRPDEINNEDDNEMITSGNQQKCQYKMILTRKRPDNSNLAPPFLRIMTTDDNNFWISCSPMKYNKNHTSKILRGDIFWSICV